MPSRATLPQTRRWVVKIGSALLTRDGQGLDRAILAPWVDQIAARRQAGHDVVLVSSGAVAEGMARLGLTHPPQGAAGAAGRRRHRPDGAGARLRGVLSSSTASTPPRSC